MSFCAKNLEEVRDGRGLSEREEEFSEKMAARSHDFCFSAALDTMQTRVMIDGPHAHWSALLGPA